MPSSNKQSCRDWPHSNVNAAGFTIHTSVLNGRLDLNCTLHVHTKVGMVRSAHAEGCCLDLYVDQT
jgi:hypothetical protein